MRKHLNNPIVVLVLAGVALALVLSKVKLGYRADVGGFDDDDLAYEEDGAEEGAIGGLIPSEVQKLAQMPIERNPFLASQAAVAIAPVETEAELPSETVLVSAIWIQSDKRFVTLDGRHLNEGASHKQIRVQKIERSGVWLELDREKRFVRPGQSWTYQYMN